MSRLAKATRRNAAKVVEGNDRWMTCEWAKVAENNDPDRLGRIKVIIPSIDEDNMHDDWVVPVASHCLGDGFGMLMIPPKGAEVLISGVLGQKFNFVYHAAVYNEEMKVPAELDIDTPGFKVPKNFSILVALLLKMQGQNLRMIAEQLAKIEGQSVVVDAEQGATLMGNTITIHSDGSMIIQAGGNVSVSANGNASVQANGNVAVSANGNVAATAAGNMTLQGRTVNKVGPPI